MIGGGVCASAIFKINSIVVAEKNFGYATRRLVQTAKHWKMHWSKDSEGEHVLWPRWILVQQSRRTTVQHMYIHVTSSLTSSCVLLKPCAPNCSSISFSDKALPVPAQNDVHLEIFTTKKRNDAVESDIHAVFIWPCWSPQLLLWSSPIMVLILELNDSLCTAREGTYKLQAHCGFDHDPALGPESIPSILNLSLYASNVYTGILGICKFWWNAYCMESCNHGVHKKHKNTSTHLDVLPLSSSF